MRDQYGIQIAEIQIQSPDIIDERTGVSSNIEQDPFLSEHN
jgi:hypothetical protein